MNARVRARLDPSRGARVVSRTPLLYARGPDASLDRPAHVRAGSALTAWSGRLAIIQDDACFLAVLDLPTTRMFDRRGGGAHNALVRDVPLPMHDGVRQFDDTRGNKHAKLDLEAAFFTADRDLLVAMGSGSSARRERVVLVEHPASETPGVSIVEAPELYALLRSERAFSGSELNVEGAVLQGDDVILFQRGNGAPAARADGQVITPVDATARVTVAPLLDYLRGGGPVPPLREIMDWDLGRIDGHRLTFTDGSIGPRSVVAFLACAEDSPNVTRDGPVSAVAIGCLDEVARTCELGLILGEHGVPILDKAEGLAFHPDDAARAFVVIDRDDPTAPSELLELHLSEAWSR